LTRLLFVLASALTPTSAFAQQFNSHLYGGLRWRVIGPFRGGRTDAAAGIPSQPNVFYVGVNNGGVWTTNDYGHTWRPIFDTQPTGSIGALALAPSDPNVIYVGSGEGLQRPDLSVGNGIYKSTDAGRTWRHLGLRNGQQIPAIIVDPQDPNRVFVAVLGHPMVPTWSAGCSARLTAAKPGRKCCIRTKTPAPWTWPSIHQTTDCVRRPLGRAPSSLGNHGLFSRTRQRLVQINRRRRHLASAHRGPTHCRPGPGPYRNRHCVQ